MSAQGNSHPASVCVSRTGQRAWLLTLPGVGNQWKPGIQAHAHLQQCMLGSPYIHSCCPHPLCSPWLSRHASGAWASPQRTMHFGVLFTCGGKEGTQCFNFNVFSWLKASFGNFFHKTNAIQQGRECMCVRRECVINEGCLTCVLTASE